MRKSRITTIFAALLLLLFTSACSQGKQSNEAASSEPAASEEGSASVNAAALVNGKQIPMSELQTAVRNVIMQNGMDAGHVDVFMGQFGPRILDQLIDAELLYQAAETEGFLAGEEDVDAAFEELSGRFATAEEFQAEMQARGFTPDTLRSSIRRQMSIQNFIQKTIVPEAVVPEETVREAYDQNPQNFVTPEEVKASHILINSAQGDAQEKKDDALKKAQEITALARKDGADFAALAREYSEGPSAPSGGDLGFFTRGRMVKPFEDKAFSMKVNEISDPVLTQFGYHVIKVTGRKESSTLSFDEVKENLEQDLTNRMVSELIGQKLSLLKDDASIEIFFTPEPQLPPGETSQDMPAN
jgi:peptidyl-prolyl cis-trans isomerase C